MKHPELDYSSPVAYTFRQRVALAIFPRVIALVLRAICMTCKLEYRFAENIDSEMVRNRRVLIAFWHEVLPLAVWCFRNRGYHTLTSYSYDGEIIARAIQPFDLRALRGSSSRGGSDALKRMQAAFQSNVTIGLTLDGPRGPRRQSKAGVAIVCARENVMVVPAAISISKCWRVNSWDRMIVPKPFSTIVCAYAPVIAPCTEGNRDEIEAKRLEIETALNTLQEQLESELNA